MKQLLLLLFILFNAWSGFDIHANYLPDDLIDWLSIRIILLVISGALSVVYILLGSKKINKYSCSYKYITCRMAFLYYFTHLL
ncbi:hypothetical protein [Nosocomiicoccus ampullae]|uniref:Integral membrane protein n=1 Tax=Nosocomiicoccus ampullae TaxID=489910 RepID=A0A9Q2HEU8_9STAP|nr:hypothetical protein [Nosocomiicoccus ampullae]MBB5175553.1 putative integral membrane protein [Nosocomiicoccus ampullae]QYA46955.1 hypothetical protein KPF49_00420 [Nosocomiicoccus ampullae]